MAKPERFAVKIISREGTESYVCDGTSDQVSRLRRPEALRIADFWRDGLGDEVQGVHVVRYPERG